MRKKIINSFPNITVSWIAKGSDKSKTWNPQKTSSPTFSMYDIYAKHPSIDSRTSMCDQHLSATTYSKQQSYPSQSPIERTTRKRPHLLSYRNHLLGGRRLAHGLISMFTVCSTLLRLCKEPLVRSWNYTYRNKEIACN